MGTPLSERVFGQPSSTLGNRASDNAQKKVLFVLAFFLKKSKNPKESSDNAFRQRPRCVLDFEPSGRKTLKNTWVFKGFALSGQHAGQHTSTVCTYAPSSASSVRATRHKARNPNAEIPFEYDLFPPETTSTVTFPDVGIALFRVHTTLAVSRITCGCRHLSGQQMTGF